LASKGRGKRRIPSAGTPKRQEAKPWPKVLIGIPTERNIMVQAMDGIIGVAMNAVTHGWGFVSFAYRRTDTGRNIMAHHLLESNAEYLAMLDSDHQHEPQVVEKLVSCAMAHPELDVIAGLNYRRSSPHEPMAYMFEGAHSLTVIANYDQPGLIDVDAVATPAILIHRRVFEQTEPPWFTYEYHQYDHGRTGSEDIAFFRKLKRDGEFRVAVHTQITSPHLRMVGVADDTLYKQWFANAPHDEDGNVIWNGNPA